MQHVGYHMVSIHAVDYNPIYIPIICYHHAFLKRQHHVLLVVSSLVSTVVFPSLCSGLSLRVYMYAFIIIFIMALLLKI